MASIRRRQKRKQLETLLKGTDSNNATRKAAFQMHCAATKSELIVSVCLIAKYSALLQPVVNALQSNNIMRKRLGNAVVESENVIVEVETITEHLGTDFNMPRVINQQKHRANPPALTSRDFYNLNDFLSEAELWYSQWKGKNVEYAELKEIELAALLTVMKHGRPVTNPRGAGQYGEEAEEAVDEEDDGNKRGCLGGACCTSPFHPLLLSRLLGLRSEDLPPGVCLRGRLTVVARPCRGGPGPREPCGRGVEPRKGSLRPRQQSGSEQDDSNGVELDADGAASNSPALSSSSANSSSLPPSFALLFLTFLLSSAPGSP
ncbi:hypothetical protein J437_LFUL015041 [Ladona fulva]|uniref:Uncharacterized protein n=1 Tax=Ladona fulva TaxID=123851 RepID=A0A8K0P6J1_LADFU|nr:hypothetical protein J437_LFUL015041 [Ladona fulva]